MDGGVKDVIIECLIKLAANFITTGERRSIKIDRFVLNNRMIYWKTLKRRCN